MLTNIKKKIFSFLLFVGKLLFKNNNSKVIYYHDVHLDTELPETTMSTPVSLFLQHIKIIKENGFEIVSKITNSKNQILITFDDGFCGVYKNKEYFIKNNIFVTIFVITSKIGTKNYLNWEQIEELKNFGFQFQSHTHSHLNLQDLKNNELKNEFLTSKTILETKLKNDVTQICFPMGLYNKNVINLAEESGYYELFNCIPGKYSFNKSLKNRYIVQFADKSDFLKIINGGMDLLKYYYKKKHFKK